jgi:hypothetical protein
MPTVAPQPLGALGPEFYERALKFLHPGLYELKLQSSTCEVRLKGGYVVLGVRFGGIRELREQ